MPLTDTFCKRAPPCCRSTTRTLRRQRRPLPRMEAKPNSGDGSTAYLGKERRLRQRADREVPCRRRTRTSALGGRRALGTLAARGLAHRPPPCQARAAAEPGRRPAPDAAVRRRLRRDRGAPLHRAQAQLRHGPGAYQPARRATPGRLHHAPLRHVRGRDRGSPRDASRPILDVQGFDRRQGRPRRHPAQRSAVQWAGNARRLGFPARARPTAQRPNTDRLSTSFMSSSRSSSASVVPHS
jgi:hypothetical protein